MSLVSEGPCPHVVIGGEEYHVFLSLYRAPKQGAKPDEPWVTWVQIFGDG